MATTLTTNAGAVKVYVNGIFNRSLPKGSFSVSNDGRKLRLEHPSYHAAIMVDVDTTLDGTSYDSLDALADAISAFNRGGTGPSPSDGVQSVTGDFVDNRDPANPVVNHPDTSQVHHSGILTPNGGTLIGDVASFLNNYANSINAIHLRTNKVINNDLTDATTSAELDSLYNSAMLGFEVISITGLVKFTFLESGSWAKETLVIA